MQSNVKMLLPVLLAVTGMLTLNISRGQNKRNAEDTVSLTSRKDTVSRPKRYESVITSKAVTDEGLFRVHKVDNKYYFEIPDSLLNVDMLIVNRVKKAANQTGPRAARMYNGDQIGERIVQFVKGPDNKLFLKSINYAQIPRSSDSTANGLYQSVQNSNLQPLSAAFDIRAFSPGGSAVVIDVTNFINADNNGLITGTGLKQTGQSFQADRSYIASVHSFAVNIEIQTVKTYASASGDGSAQTWELNSSFVLLPKKPMTPRYHDSRVGYFVTGYTDFDVDPQSVKSTYMLTRWRLEPRPEDKDRYQQGELVEPVKPIIFYIDPATPKKWVPFLIQGVNAWQHAFEKAGFKNAIFAKEAPVNDPEWSLEDARHSAIIYKASDIQNASGPHVHDPRSGEILESHINWYHNVMKLARDWYMLQAGINDPAGRKMTFDDSLMGKLIRYVCTHEVGHTLGLAHNFGASVNYPTDSLRSIHWLQKKGHTPSIMDYARFNYVAQPEDHIPVDLLLPRIGEYDEWAIEWGYRWLPAFATRDQETTYMNKWVIDRTSRNKGLWYGFQPVLFFGQEDARLLAEDLGDNAVKSSTYGIKNLKRMVPQLVEWTKEPNANQQSFKTMYTKLRDQYRWYLYHVYKKIGSHNENERTNEEDGPLFEYPSKKEQKDAVAFLQANLFTTPDWLLQVGAARNINQSITSFWQYYLLSTQKWMLQNVMSYKSLTCLNRAEEAAPDKAYPVKELLNDLKSGIWSELKLAKPIDRNRRNLQKLYTEQLMLLLCPQKVDPKTITSLEDIASLEQSFNGNFNANTDLIPLIKDHMERLMREIDVALPKYHDEMSVMHLREVKSRLKDITKAGFDIGKVFIQRMPSGNTLDLSGDRYMEYFMEHQDELRNCWNGWQVPE